MVIQINPLPHIVVQFGDIEIRTSTPILCESTEQIMNFFSELLGTLKPQASQKVGEQVLRQRQLTPKVTATRIPFVQSQLTEEYHPDQSILEAINEIDITEEQFRSSAELKQLLSDIVSSIALFHCWGKQSVKVRLNAFIKLLVAQLCIPELMSLYGVGSSILSVTSDANRTAFLSNAKNALIEAFTLFKLSEELLLDKMDDSSLDQRRVHLFLVLIEFKCSSFFAHGITVRQFGGEALQALSCHLLSVSAVTHSVLESIKIVVSRMTNVLSCETANYTIQQCRPILEEIVLDYFRWLRQNFDSLVRLCRKEEIITSVDASTRAWLRAETYASPVEILSVYQQKYRKYLTHMSIPLQPYKRKDIEQTKKDLVREKILLNNVEYHGGYSVLLNDAHDHSTEAHVQKELFSTVKSELRKVLSFLFEIDTFQIDLEQLYDTNDTISDHTEKESAASSLDTLPPADSTYNDESEPVLHRDRLSNTHDSGPTLTTLKPQATKSGTATTSQSPQDRRPVSQDHSSRSARHFGHLLRLHAARTPSPALSPVPPQGGRAQSGDFLAENDSTHPRRSRDLQDSPFWEFDLLDALYAYTILAASRTFAGGDAFLILNDLYGGEGLTLCPCKTPRLVTKFSPTGTFHFFLMHIFVFVVSIVLFTRLPAE